MRMIIYKAGDGEDHRKVGSLLRELPPGEYLITIKKNRPVRSLNANKYYHMIINMIGIETGHTHEQLHDICKKKFNYEIVTLPKSGSEIMGMSTSNLDTKEFAAYVNRVKQWAMDEFNIVIPEPKDVDYAKWMEIENNYNRVQSGF